LEARDGRTKRNKICRCNALITQKFNKLLIIISSI
jgi:hypothetical protein